MSKGMLCWLGLANRPSTFNVAALVERFMKIIRLSVFWGLGPGVQGTDSKAVWQNLDVPRSEACRCSLIGVLAFWCLARTWCLGAYWPLVSRPLRSV